MTRQKVKHCGLGGFPHEQLLFAKRAGGTTRRVKGTHAREKRFLGEFTFLDTLWFFPVVLLSFSGNLVFLEIVFVQN
jgi:hypothetical protein